jgi:hypothetical protein
VRDLIGELVFRFAWLRFDLRAGFMEGYPLCCIVRFTAEHAISPLRPLARERSGSHRGRGYVPCGILHGSDAKAGSRKS